MSVHLTDAEVRGRTDAVSRSRTFRNLRARYGLDTKKVFDIGCGYGEYLALFGRGSVGITTTNDEVEFGKRNGSDIRMGNAEALDELKLTEKFDAVWANNLYEHLLSPHSFLMFLRAAVADDGLIILGVPVVPRIVSLMRLRRFRGALATNHINFFTKHTLRLTVERAGWHVEEVRPFIFRSLFLDMILAPFAPHLYVVARSEPGFQYPEKKLKEWTDDPRYEKLLAAGGRA